MDIAMILSLTVRIVTSVLFVITTIVTAFLIYYCKKNETEIDSGTLSNSLEEAAPLFFAGAKAFSIIIPFVVLGLLWLFFAAEILRFEVALMVLTCIQVPLILRFLKNIYLNHARRGDMNGKSCIS
ncbi:MAG: hypothetical protein HXS52_12055 [Theionarchaea archaeon]|nr:hypothetical protein [Theionarchaea archaeon]